MVKPVVLDLDRDGLSLKDGGVDSSVDLIPPRYVSSLVQESVFWTYEERNNTVNQLLLTKS